MKITRIIIKKFRSVEKADIWISDINAIVGQNNSGKSCLLRALNSFFNYEEEQAAFNNGAHSYAPGTVSKIEIHFDVTAEDAFPTRFITRSKLIAEASFQSSKAGYSRTLKYKKSSKWHADDGLIDEIKKHIEFVLIPPNRDAYALEAVERSILNRLTEQKMSQVTGSRDNYSVKFKSAIDYLESHALKEISKSAKSEFPVAKKLDMKIAYSKQIGYQQFLQDMRVFIKEGGLEHPLEECGSGIQSMVIIALYNLLAKEMNEKIILALEEPETNLHPQAQKELIAYFKDLVEEKNFAQFFFTTHSAQIIDEVDHTDVVVFRKTNDANRGFKSIASRLPSDFYDLYDLDEFKYYQYHRYRNSDFFFSSFVVVTESKNEIEMIHRMAEKTNNNFDVNGLSYLSMDGVGNASYVIHLLTDLEIPFLLIVDKDFFCEYQNDAFDASIDHQGFPLYKSEFKDPDIVNLLINNRTDQDTILANINSNHTVVLDTLERYGIVSMRYTLDIDLVSIERARDCYYEIFNVPEASRSVSELTVQRKKGIKKIGVLTRVFDQIAPRNWPYSYSRIKNRLVEVAKELKT